MKSRRLQIKLLLFTVVFLTSAYVFHPKAGYNVNSRIDLTYAIVDLGSFEITLYVAEDDYLTQDVASFNGHIYSDKIIGTSLLGVLPYQALSWIANMAGTTPSANMKRFITRTFSVSILSALAVTILFSILLSMEISPRTAFFTALLLHFGTLLFPFSTLFYSYGPATFFALISYLIIFDMPYIENRRGALIFLAGLCMGTALLCEYIYFWVFLGLFVFCVYRVWKAGMHKGTILLFPIGASLPLLLFAAYLLTIFGRIVLPYTFEVKPVFQEGMRRGFMGLTYPKLAVLYYITIHPYRGIFFQSPFLLVSVWGMLQAIRKGGDLRAPAIFTSILVIVYLLFNSAYYMWWGGWVMGPRHLIPMLPFLGVWYALAWRDTGCGWRIVFGILAAISIVNIVAPAMVEPQIPQGHETAALLSARISDNLSNPVYYAAFPAFFRGRLAMTGMDLVWSNPRLWAMLPLFILWGFGAALGWKLTGSFDIRNDYTEIED